MKKTESINSNWLLRYCDYGRGERFDFHREENTEGWLPATVPGDVHLDLMAAGLIADPFFGLESDHCLWMEEKDWWYRTTFRRPEAEGVKGEKRVFLLFHGLDTFATVYLNGHRLGCHQNMFTPLRIDITAELLNGENDLRVRLASPAYSPRIHRDSLLARTPPQRLCSRKAQASYGWDIAPRLVTIGLWRPVELLVCDPVEIADAWIRTEKIAGSTAQVTLEFSIAVHDDLHRQVLIDVKVFDQKRQIALTLDAARNHRSESFTLQNPPLWWPHNHGAPALLPYSITLSKDHQEIDRCEGVFGVRTIEMVQEPLAGNKRSFYFKVNGKPVFLKGMNWTPCDAIYARIDDARYEKLLTKAVESNINTLRVWGGGIYETPAFYHLCDRLGILIWQDFMFACGVYPQDGTFLDEVKQEAETIVKQLRNHPSLFIWCGDNEVDWVYLQENVPEFWHNRINRELLPQVCRALDASRPYIVSSPFSHGHEHPNAPASGDVHLWKHGASYRDEYYTGCFPNMVTEMGHIGLPDLTVLKQCIPADKLWPPFNEHWYMHCADPNRSGDSYRVQSYFDSIRANGLPAPQTVEELIHSTQQLQTDATTFWIEHFSAQPECWGLFLWNLCDAWPQISDAYIAYPFHVKPALAAVQEGFGKITR